MVFSSIVFLSVFLPAVFLLYTVIPSLKVRNALLIAAMLYLLFMVAFNKLLTVSYANWLCETYMNPKIEGAQTNIGLRPENWDDTEYRPEDDE